MGQRSHTGLCWTVCLPFPSPLTFAFKLLNAGLLAATSPMLGLDDSNHLNCTPAVPGGSRVAGSRADSELDLDSSHSSAANCCCCLYWGKENLSNATEEKVKGGVHASFLAHSLAPLDNSNNKINSHHI